MDADTAEVVRMAARRPPASDVRERGRQHVHVMTALGHAFHQLAGHDDRSAECDRGEVRRRCEQDAHAGDRTGPPRYPRAVKPRLLVLNQYYWPGVEATANLLTELCEALVETYDVTVIAGAAADQPHESVRNGVRIIRVRSTTYDRAELWRRASNYGTYIVGALREAFRVARPEVVMCMTDPPFI